MDYISRSLQGETILEMKALNDMLQKKAKEVFISEINGLQGRGIVNVSRNVIGDSSVPSEEVALFESLNTGRLAVKGRF